MSFEVHPEKIDTYHNLLTDLAGQTGQAKTYLGNAVNLSMWEKGLIGQGIWAQAISRMGDAKDAIDANMDRLTELSNGSATELARSATMYRNTDRKHAEQLDNTY
ncbi:MAG TPA: type VII secretion target [Actinophytocola sp.]|jgi:hypothetical protein|uniref:type VII secretion target n=1 Tax=Actinophytocola sp. TaxID=1872138 RepID=UPI002F93D0C0